MLSNSTSVDESELGSMVKLELQQHLYWLQEKYNTYMYDRPTAPSLHERKDKVQLRGIRKAGKDRTDSGVGLS